MGPEEGFWLQLMLLTMVASCWLIVRVLILYRQYQFLGRTLRLPAHGAARQGRAQAVAGAGAALMQPPDLGETMQSLARQAPSARYRFPLGWSLVNGQAVLSQAAFVGDVNHILLTAQSDGGKDNWTIGALVSLLTLHSPGEVQVCILDGKGLDFAHWAGLPHIWRTALSPPEIAPTMQALSAERERRRRILSAAGVSKWESYEGGDLPLLVVYVSELSLLQDATSARVLEQWLNSELAAGRAFGLRYIIATQTASNFATRWRSQISLCIAGFQPSQSQDTPNTGLRTQEIQASGAVPPSALPGPPTGAGVFCVVAGREAVNVRAPFIADAERRRWREVLSRSPGRTDAEDAESVKCIDTPALPDLPDQAASIDLATAWISPAELVRDSQEMAPARPSGRTGSAHPGSARTDTNKAGDGSTALSDDELMAELVRRGVSANKIRDVLGGTKAVVLGKVRELRSQAS